MNDFSSRLIAWQKQQGRHDLPWQNTQDPYAIWVSEIMLQQTQVAAVVGYYQRFMQRFPTIADLASADQDEVLQYWSGLGYYARARNLHQAAQMIINEFKGKFPDNFSLIQTLPGVGRSTAAAIAAFAYGQSQAILDGNVKRVLTRFYAIEGWPGNPNIEKKLWALAEKLLPEREMIAYTQGLMDLGATVCKRSKPLCERCPLQNNCESWLQKSVHLLPTPKPRKTLPEKQTTMLILMHADSILLEKRPANGIWGGLWGFPETDDSNPQNYASEKLGEETTISRTLPTFSHTFTHFRLIIKPIVLTLLHGSTSNNPPGCIWINIQDALSAAIPTPVRKLLETLHTHTEHVDTHQ